ncbi:MAG TPA: IS1182 family transposase [Spirochaetes bacterium]|nr:IS1182 family transposase [Spirochaetota bacterium]
MARYKTVDRDQMVMLPVSLDQLVEEDHLAKKIYFLLDSGLIDLSAFEEDFNNDESGALAYHPKNILAILIYAYSSGIRSSRVIEQLCYDNLAYMYLADLQKPDHTTLANFRTKHDHAFEEIFSQTVFLGIEAGLIDFKHIASDGTKMDGAGSRSQLVNGNKIASRIEKCEQRVKEILKEAELADGKEIKSNLEKKTKKLSMKLDKLHFAKKEYDRAKTGIKEEDEKLRYHLSESQARLLKDKDGYHSGYNAQTSVDSKTQMILAKRVTQSENDSGEGLKTREDLISRYGKPRLEGSIFSFDNGYHNQELIRLDGEDAIGLLVSQGNKSTGQGDFRYNRERDVFICPEGKDLSFQREKILSGRVFREYRLNGCSNCLSGDLCFKKGAKNKRQKLKLIEKDKLELRETFETYQEKMNRQEVKKEYKNRMATVEPVFGHMTYHRKASRFHVWGLLKADMEYSLMCIVHNLVKIIKYSNLDPLKAWA